VGYNSLRFDDEVTRFTLYRNFYDPYAREWQNGCSRWDVIDMVRLTHALRPQGIEWPLNEAGVVSFRLELLSAANGIAHAAAHDALSDVHATIALAKLIRQRQPRLFDYVFSGRDKQTLGERLNLQQGQPVSHVSSMYPAETGCIAMVMPLARDPVNPNGIIVYDLRYDPTPLLELDSEEIHRRLFTPSSELEEGTERIPLKTVHLNKCPVVVPMNTLTDEAAERWSIDVAAGERHRRMILAQAGLAQKLQAVYRATEFDPVSDPDLALYSGDFFSRDDRRRMDRIVQSEPAALHDFPLVFDDPRLPEMLFRYRARNWPETLDEEEQARWAEYRSSRLSESDGGASITLDTYLATLDRLEADPQLPPEKRSLIPQLLAWAEQIAPE
jgi:exodeoxyribonuclease-1